MNPTPSPKRLFIIAVAAAVAGLILTLSFGYADHAPKPHGVRVAVSATPSVESQLAAGLAKKSPGSFTLFQVAGTQAATHAVRTQSAAGALLVPVSGATNTLITAGAQGTLQAQVLTEALSAASAAMHRGVKRRDVAPLGTGDESGLSSFVFGLGLLVPSVIASVGLFLLGARLRLWCASVPPRASRCSCHSVAPWRSTRSSAPCPAGSR